MRFPAEQKVCGPLLLCASATLPSVQPSEPAAADCRGRGLRTPSEAEGLLPVPELGEPAR